MFNPFNLNHQNPFKGIDMNSICYFDTETTGLHPKNSQIVEIAAITGNTFFHEKINLTEDTLLRIKHEENNFVRKKKRDKTIVELLEMSCYYEGDIKKVSEKEALLKFKQFVSKSKILIAHNASFDMKMVNERCKKYNIPPIRGIKVYDTLAFSRRFFIPSLITIENTSKLKHSREKAKLILNTLTKQYYKSGQRKNVSSSLEYLSEALLGKLENHHQAMSDVQALKVIVEKVFKAMFERHYIDTFGYDIRSKQTFQKYYMRNVRAENRYKEMDKKNKTR